MKACTFIVPALVILAACGPAPEITYPELKATEEPLHSKTKEEMVKLKYDSQMVECELRLQAKELLDMASIPTKNFSWKLPQEEKEVRTVDVEFGEYKGTMTFKIAKIEIVENLYLTTLDKKEYQMYYSPVIDIHRSEKLTHSAGPMVFESDSMAMKLNENVGKLSHYQSTKSPQGVPHHKDLNCKYVTKIKEEYKHQFQEIK
ncbi:MAG TPA: hypothetical protein VNJ01_17325 [Bacteriovoracaceae bacterium]|nr:hypothetical protein [Bacteriovoracaceae bacterium]